MDTITVWHNGIGLLVSKEVAERLELKHGQTILTDAHFREVLNANATWNINDLKLKIKNNQ